MGMVYWITGLSGAGKTTIGKLLYEKIEENNPNTVFLDGDILRKVFGDDLGYSRKEVAGIHFDIEEPKYPNLILENDGDRIPEEQVKMILQM